jgi:hypothetical protein
MATKENIQSTIDTEDFLPLKGTDRLTFINPLSVLNLLLMQGLKQE